VKFVLLAALAALLALPALARAALPESGAVQSGVDFIRTTQQDDGGFGGFGPGQSMDAIYAIRAAGLDPNTFVSATGATPSDYLVAMAAAATEPQDAAKATLAAVALGLDPRAVGGVDFVAVIEAAFDADSGRHHASDFNQAIIVVALVVAGEAVPVSAPKALVAGQLADGGWGFGDAGDADSTAIVVQALIAAGSQPDDAVIAAAIAFLAEIQAEDGGWGFGGDSNANSTAFVVQALVAAAIDPEGPQFTTASGATPIAYLLSQQQADGSFAGFDPAFATNQVVPALAGRTFASAPVTPLAPPAPATPTPEPTAEPMAPVPTATVPAPEPPSTGTGTGQATGASGAIPLLALASVLTAVIAAGGALLARQRR